MSAVHPGRLGGLPPVPSALLDELRTAAPNAVHHRATDRLKYAHDASHFLLTPRRWSPRAIRRSLLGSSASLTRTRCH
jgi:hypothetical protein